MKWNAGLMSIVRKLMFSLSAAGLFFLGLEGVLRLTVPESRLLLSWEREDGPLFFMNRSFDSLEDARTEKRTYDLGSRPYSSFEAWDGPYHWAGRVNGWGLREDGPTPAKKEADIRLLALGDSWMFGFSVEQGKTLCDQLEKLLPERLGVERVEVLNGGVFGSDSLDMVRRWHYLKYHLELDGVLLGLPHNNRTAEIAERRKHWYSTVAGAPYFNSRVYLVLRRALLPFSRPHYPQLRVTAPPAGQLDYPIQLAVEDLGNLIRDARQMGLDAWMVLFPGHMQSTVNSPPPNMRHWTEPLADTGVKYAGHALQERSCWGFKDQWHPSEAGHRAIAEVVADLIASGRSDPVLKTTPRCADVPGIGPGKPGSPPWQD